MILLFEMEVLMLITFIDFVTEILDWSVNANSVFDFVTEIKDIFPLMFCLLTTPVKIVQPRFSYLT